MITLTMAARVDAGGAVTVTVEEGSTKLFVGEYVYLRATYEDTQDPPDQSVSSWTNQRDQNGTDNDHEWTDHGSDTGAGYTAVAEDIGDGPKYTFTANLSDGTTKSKSKSITVVSSGVKLTIHKIGPNNSTGPEVDEVRQGTSVRLVAKLQNTEATGSVQFYLEPKNQDGSWPSSLPPVSGWTSKPINQGEAYLDVALSAANEYRGHADYTGEQDSSKITATAPKNYKVVTWVQSAQLENDTILDLMEDRDLPMTTAQIQLIEFVIEQINLSANPAPPSSFTPESWQSFVDSKQYRGYSFFTPNPTCDPSGNITSVSLSPTGNSQGYTPSPNGGAPFSAGVGNYRAPTATLGNSCTDLRGTNLFMVGLVGQWGWDAAFGRLPPFAWHRIEVQTCCDSDGTPSWSGSRFPNHKAYIDDQQEASHTGNGEAAFLSFVNSPPGSLAAGTGF